MLGDAVRSLDARWRDVRSYVVLSDVHVCPAAPCIWRSAHHAVYVEKLGLPLLYPSAIFLCRIPPAIVLCYTLCCVPLLYRLL